jgi:hypothetical protein
VHQIGFERIAALLTGPATAAGGKMRLIETGIKVIDVMCPLVAGGTVKHPDLFPQLLAPL